MLRFVIQKIKNRKWMNFCLFAGITLLVGVFTCHPIFRQGVGDQLLDTSFREYAEKNEEYPVVLQRVGSVDDTETTFEELLATMESYEQKWLEYVDLPVIANQMTMQTPSLMCKSSLGQKRYIAAMYMTDLEEHIKPVHGSMETEVTEDGVYPCVISESVMDAGNLTVGETLTVTARDKSQVTFLITGVIRESSNTDNYWYHTLSDYERTVFVSKESMQKLLAAGGLGTITYEMDLMLDHTGINVSNLSEYCSYLEQFTEADVDFTANCLELLQNCETQQRTANLLLLVLEVPEIVLLLLFIYMISMQLLDAEEGEIAMLHSRGFTKAQIVRLYLLRSVCLALAGLVMGTLLGFGMCRIAARTDAFLQFVPKDVHFYTFTPWVIPFGLAACLIAVMFMTFPVWKRAGLTIVQQKSKKEYTTKKPFWEKYLLDIALLLVSCYLLYNYNKQSDVLAQNMLDGNLPDVMIFLDASLFIFSAGLFFLRLLRYLIAGIDRLGKKRWSPAVYAAFLQIRRTFVQQSFLSVFLIMTIATGIFHANMARTMNENNEQRIAYNIGTDARVQETWKAQIRKSLDGNYLWSYTEPDYEPYQLLVEEGLCQSVTRVIEENETVVSASKKKIDKCRLLGIHTKEFGETAELMDGLNAMHWFYALNALAEEENGVIISSNLAESLSLSVGDKLTYKRWLALPSIGTTSVGSGTGKVCAIIDCFPGYNRYEKDGEETYLVVANYASLVADSGQVPYSVWLRLTDGVTYEQAAQALVEKGVEPKSSEVLADQIEESRSSAMIQITNGMFTMSFCISILLCSVGFLIYWIMSLQRRELLLGIYRAMGMSMREVQKMLAIEQIFASLFPAVAGIGAGAVGTQLFARLIALVYLPDKHNIPIRIMVNPWDMVKLSVVVLLVAVLCYLLMQRMLRKMKIAEAIKLGED